MLKVESLNQYYGGSHILRDVGFEARVGEVTVVLGRNGVGKTTLLKSLMGVVTPRAGSIVLDGADLAGRKSHRIAQAGMQLVHEERRIFGTLSVEENIVIAGLTAPKRWPLERIYEMFPRLRERRGNRGTELSGGEQQMLAIARALMVNPRLLLLDEPMEGLAPIIVQELTRIIAVLVKQGMTVIVVEQHARLALSLTSRAIVLERGRVVHDGESRGLLDDPLLLGNLLAVA